jgi:hypothetical protein
MRLLGVLLACLLLLAPSAGKAEPRIALVIGNNAYSGSLDPLENAVSDAILISDRLRKAGFEVDEVHDANRATTAAALARFRDKVKAAGPGAAALFYFAGHGLQSNGVNYLIATDAPIGGVDDIARFGIDADTVLNAMMRGGAEVNILVLDACRPNQVAARLRPVAAAGLAEIDARGKDPERSVLVAYSTGLGQAAADGDDGNSPYAKTLASHMLQPGLPLEILFRNVRLAMVNGGHQKPWESSGMLKGFAFLGEPLESAPQPAPPIKPGAVLQVADFNAVPAKLGIDKYVPAERYLKQGAVPVAVRDVVPSTSEITFFSTATLYQGRAVSSTVSDNVLTQFNTGNVPASFTLSFPMPLKRVRFLIPRLFAATESGVTFPAWTAIALDETGSEVDRKGRELIGSYTDIPEQFVQLQSPDGRPITSVTFQSDPNLNGRPFAAFSALLIEGIWIEAMP